MKELVIGEVARRSGVAASTLRYYEDKGLIRSVGRRGLSRVEQETLREEGAVAEALGFYLSADGRVVGGGSSLAFKPEDIGRKNRAAAVAAGRAKAEAILAVCAHHPHKLLVVDEGAALRMIELLRR